MRIRGSEPSLSSFSSSSSSSCFSSSPDSTISTHSLTSSSDSTSSSFSLSSNRRCEGLDLLVKAVYHVAGSVVGVPYIQKRVIRRRKPAARFTNFTKEERENVDGEEGVVFDCNLEVQKKKQLHKKKSLILQSRKPCDRPRRRSNKIEV